MSYRHPRGIALSGRVYGVFAHSADYQNWGMSGMLEIVPGADGQGLALSLSPS